MGCLSARVSRIGTGLEAEVLRAGNGLHGRVSRIGTGLQATIGLVCSVNKAKYLRVEPEHIWLMKGNDYMDDVVVWSNVEWHVS